MEVPLAVCYVWRGIEIALISFYNPFITYGDSHLFNDSDDIRD
jgi:hypothetical protein